MVGHLVVFLVWVAQKGWSNGRFMVGHFGVFPATLARGATVQKGWLHSWLMVVLFVWVAFGATV